ncbi:MAG TPA: inorganic phosphate transporter [Tepidisphaeraceae bacterium]|nr:inorganic phosphate transporter [Tepidisphaeraceae bacterium]
MLPFLAETASAAAPQNSGGFIALVLVIIFVALVFDFLNGFHDAANSIATVVSTRVLTPTQAVMWAAFFNFVAAFVFGTGVAKTIGKDVIDVKQIDVYVVFGGLVGACVWNLITWWLALPTSSSHALLAGFAGAAVAKAGFPVVKIAGWYPIFIWIVLAPLIGFVIGAILMIAVSWIFRRSTPHRVDTLFRRLQLASAGIYSLAHGGNDAQKTMGIIVALLAAAHLDSWVSWGVFPKLHLFGDDTTIGFPIIIACHAAIALGTMFGGWRIVKTMGSGITRLQPVGGFCAEAAAASTIIFATMTKVPLSTTHAITGSILGVGTTKGVRSVRWIWGQRIIMAWILTIPCAAFIGAITYAIIHKTIEPFFAK